MIKVKEGLQNMYFFFSETKTEFQLKLNQT